MLKQLWKILNGASIDSSKVETPKNRFNMIEFQANDPSQDRVAFGAIEQIDAHYLAVFDGHGGSKVSEYLKKNIHNIIISVIKNRSRIHSDNETLIKISLQQIFQVVQQNILQIMNKQALDNSNQFQECGSCALIAIITKTHVYVANAGDSQGLIINSDPFQHRITNSQLNTKLTSEVERLKKKFPKDQDLFVYSNNAYYLKGKIMLTHSIGDFSLKYKKPDRSMLQRLRNPYLQFKPDINVYKIDGNDKFVLLASDGLWDILEPSEVSELVLNNPKDDCLRVVMQRCFQKCARNMSVSKSEMMSLKPLRKYIDDISMVLFDLSQKI